jgi:hypothetical protein
MDARYNGKCKCGKWHTYATKLSNVTFGASTYVRITFEGTDILSDQPMGHEGSISVTCTCGKRVTLKRVKGTVSNDHLCDNRCLIGKGIDCMCSCGGLNHGKLAV